MNATTFQDMADQGRWLSPKRPKVSKATMGGSRVRSGARAGTLVDLVEAVTGEEWMRYGSCVGSPNADAWFPVRGAASAENVNAVTICRTCPVRLACLAYAVEHEDTLQGIWGGLNEYQRRPLRQQRDDELTA